MASLVKVLLVSVIVVGGVSGAAQQGVQEKAIARTADDKQLTWGPCPEFMPKGCSLAVLHGDPAKPNADVFLRLPAKGVVPDHWHTSEERMILVSGELQVTYKGQPMTTLKPGMYAYGPAKLPHSAVCASSTPCVLFVAFESAVDAVPTAASK